jgi:hypothetical protein
LPGGDFYCTQINGHQTCFRQMIRKMYQRLRSLWRAEFLSPKDLVQRAAVITIAFVILELAGLREYTCILNGTMGSVELGWKVSALLGVVYVMVYLAFVLLVPPLLSAALLLVFWNKYESRKRSAATVAMAHCDFHARPGSERRHGDPVDA